MWETWKRAWQEAVENFRREVADGGGSGAMHRELAAARAELRRLEDDIVRTRRQLAEEREAAERCRRQHALARGIGDDETASIAARFADKHTERARVLATKLEALEAELALRTGDVREMEAILQAAEPPSAALHADDADDAFDRLDRETRERMAQERLEELKRRMRG